MDILNFFRDEKQIKKVSEGMKMEITASNCFIYANCIKQFASEKAKETGH